MHPAATERIGQASQAKQQAAESTLTARTRVGAVALVLAGLCFVVYPTLRPFSSEVGLDGAAAFGSNNWILAHMFAMVGFTLLAVGLLCWYTTLVPPQLAGRGFWALVVTIAGIGLTLPFYGGEAFGLHAIGQRAQQQNTPDLVSLSDTVRGGAGLALFLTGLLVLALGTILVAITIWKARVFSRWSGVPLAIAFGLYIPQFFGTQPLRVAHGLIVTLGCVWVAVELWRQGNILQEK